MTSSNGNIFRVTGSLCGELTGHRRISLAKANAAGLDVFYLICAWTNWRANNQDTGNLRRRRAHNDVTSMLRKFKTIWYDRNQGNEKEGIQIGRSVGECCPSSITMYMLGSLAKVHLHRVHGVISKSHKTSYRKISQNLDGAKTVFGAFESPWNMVCFSAALLSNIETVFGFIHICSDRNLA